MGAWLEIAVSVEAELVETVAGLFEALHSGGVVIEDPALVREYAAVTHPDEWGVPEQQYLGQQPLLKAYFPVDEHLDQRLSRLRGMMTRLGLDFETQVTTKTVRDEDWATAWQAYYKPVRVGSRLVVKPSWEQYPAAADDLVIELDPGLAFGCGTHATTALCLVLLEKYLTPGDVVFDVGAGTGILAVAAAKLGAGEVWATDHDPLACRVARENVTRNQAAELVRVMRGDLLEPLRGKTAKLIVANIIADVIRALAPEAAKLLCPGGIFIASGIIRERRDSVVAALEDSGLALREQLEQENWVALVGVKD